MRGGQGADGVRDPLLGDDERETESAADARVAIRRRHRAGLVTTADDPHPKILERREQMRVAGAREREHGPAAVGDDPLGQRAAGGEHAQAPKRCMVIGSMGMIVDLSSV
jgi:hypothetical protein